MSAEIPLRAFKMPEVYFDTIVEKEKKRDSLTPAPPKPRSKEEMIDAKMVKKFSKRY